MTSHRDQTSTTVEMNKYIKCKELEIWFNSIPREKSVKKKKNPDFNEETFEVELPPSHWLFSDIFPS